MNFERLQLFLTVVEAGSVTAGAKAAHRTQPALSRNLQLLQDELGAPLFARHGRGLTLTAAGRALVPRAHELLGAVGAVALDVRRAAERDYHDLRMGVIDSVATFLFPRVVEPLRTQFPKLALRLATARTAVLKERLEAGELDLAIVAHSGAPKGLPSVHLGAYPLRYFGRKDRFPQLKNVNRPEALHAFPIVELDPGPGQIELRTEASQSHALASNIATVKALVLSGFGVGDLADFMLSNEERRLLVAAPFTHDPNCGLFLVRSEAWGGRTELKLVEAIAVSMRDQLQPHFPPKR